MITVEYFLLLHKLTVRQPYTQMYVPNFEQDK